jgi:uncharacterized protein (TIGR02594 family)
MSTAQPTDTEDGGQEISAAARTALLSVFGIGPTQSLAATDDHGQLAIGGAASGAVPHSSNYKALNFVPTGGGNVMKIASQFLDKGADDPQLQAFIDSRLGRHVDLNTTPWCAALMNACYADAGYHGTGSDMALSFLNGDGVIRGQQRNVPVGATVMLSRNIDGHNDGVHGHVAICMGYDKDNGNIILLGGNQGHEVSIQEFDPNRVLGYRMPDAGTVTVASNQPPAGRAKPSIQSAHSAVLLAV